MAVAPAEMIKDLCNKHKITQGALMKAAVVVENIALNLTGSWFTDRYGVQVVGRENGLLACKLDIAVDIAKGMK